MQVCKGVIEISHSAMRKSRKVALTEMKKDNRDSPQVLDEIVRRIVEESLFPTDSLSHSDSGPSAANRRSTLSVIRETLLSY